MAPRFSVIENTTPHLTFAEDVAVLRQSGTDGIGIIEGKLLDDATSLHLVRGSGLGVSSFHSSCSAILPSTRSPNPQDPDLRIEAMCRSIRRIQPFSPESCFISTGPVGSYTAARARQIVVEGIRLVSSVAAECGMRLGLELMHPSLAGSSGFVNSIRAGVELMDAVGDPNFGLTLDIWHLGSPEDLLEEIRANANRVVAVHVNDRRNPTRSWCDRVLPGDGVADVPGVLASLEAGGFDGWYELEVLSDDGTVENDFPDSLWKRSPLEFITEGRAKFLAAWEARLVT